MTLKKSQEEMESERVTTDGAVKKPYAEPALMVYGTIRGMTATGTGTQMELGNQGGESNPNDPKRRP